MPTLVNRSTNRDSRGGSGIALLLHTALLDEISESILSGIDGKEKMKELRKFLTTPFRISLDGIVCSIDPTDGISAVQDIALESIKGVMKLKGSNKRRGEKRKRRMFVNTKQGASTFDLAIQRDSIGKERCFLSDQRNSAKAMFGCVLRCWFVDFKLGGPTNIYLPKLSFW